MHTRHHNHHLRSGQAMIELMIGMILILILLAGIGQFLQVAYVHTDMDATVRGAAGTLAMSSTTKKTPHNIQTWLPGPDNQRFTADDVEKAGSPATIATIAGDSVAKASDWAALDFEFQRLAPAHFPSLDKIKQQAGALTELGFVVSPTDQSSKTVPVFDLARSLFYDKKDITVKEDVWMPIMSGLY